MKHPQRELKLYNVIFPVWMMMLFPTVWLIVLPGNFIIDSLVLIICMFALKMEEKKRFYLRHVFLVFAFGLLSDLIGSGYLFLLTFGFEVRHIDALYVTLPAVLIAAACIFALNYFITFRKVEGKARRTLSLVFAIATAPYTFLIPLNWIY